MNYYEDAMSQLRSILQGNVNNEIKSLYLKEIEKIFCGIYIINYVSNRIELKKFFNSAYFGVSFSCLIESFSLLLNNYPRAALLVLRSCLESFIKFIIEVYSKGNFEINDRSYRANKSTLDKIITDTDDFPESFKEEGISLNSKMEAEYSRLSGLSHSLTPEIKNNTINYFSDLNKVNNENIKLALERFLNVINHVFSFCIIICQPSFKNWDTFELDKIFRMVFGQRRTKTFLKLVKM